MKEEPRCLACGQAPAINGHLCLACLIERAHTIHPRWLDQSYLQANQREDDETKQTPIINAAEARYELRRQKRRERIA